MSLRPMLFASQVDPILRAAAARDTTAVGAAVASVKPERRKAAQKK